MTFDEILEQAIALLRRRGRLTYRALKRQFDLDDDILEDLKEEILYSQPQVVDDEGKGLIWAGDAAIRHAPASTTPDQQDMAPQAQPSQVEPPLTDSPTPDAERRQLTVMFCDLVESTKLSSQLDPEDYREVVRAYQKVCSEVITRFDGYVAQLLGDGLLVYFGYPVAHEDDAQRAIHTGLKIIQTLQTLQTRLEQEKGIRLAIRLGIHTGLVVVGEMGGAGRQEQLALGETPNIAARIQGLAEPDTVVVSETTHRLIQGYFDCQALGEQTLRGVAQPLPVYQVLQESGLQSRLDVVAARGLTPLVGRESESTLLFERWQQAKAAQGQVVLLSGEAGIGKSRLVQVLKDHVAAGIHTRLECRSLPYFTHSALYPITDFLQRMLRFQTDDIPEQRLEKLEQNLRAYRLPLEEAVPLFATLLSLPVPEDRCAPLSLSPQRQRQKMLEALVAVILELAEQQPVLFILEDLHWTDPTTLEWLALLIDQTPTASLCVLLTCRPDFQPAWSHRSYLTEVTVNRLSPSQIERLAEQVAGGRSLPDEVLGQIVAKTDGVPLYVEEMTKSVLESGLLKEAHGAYKLTSPLLSLSIPATLQDSLMARLDRLGTAKSVAQYASVIGRQFSYELLQAFSQLDDATLQRELGRLVEAELIYQRGVVPDATYLFKHALIQDTAYASLLRSTRQGYHRRIAAVLEEKVPETAANQPELLAHHYTAAGIPSQALPYWQQAGQRAHARSAYAEAEAYLTKGLEMLATLPETPERAQHELALHLNLGPALMATRGHHTEEVERVYRRARELCQQVGETPQLFAALAGLHRFYYVQGALHTARELGEQFLTLAKRQEDPALLLTGHWLIGTPLLWLGEVTTAHEHFEQTRACFDPYQHRGLALRYGLDPGSASRIFTAITLWTSGYADQALQRSQEALTLVQELTHPFSQAYVLFCTAVFHWLRRDAQSTSENVDACISLATERGFPIWIMAAGWLRGAALALQGHLDAGIAQLLQGLHALRATQTGLLDPMILVALAEAHTRAGRPEVGRELLVDAQEVIARTAQHFWEAEVYRLQGECLLAQSAAHASETETCLHQAMTIAQSQQAKSWELRAATSLARLWQTQGKRQDATDLLAPVYGWFTEGFNTADLQEAKTLLDELA